MRTLSRTVLIATLALAASACGSSAPTRVGTTSVPTGADEVVFRIDSRGGLTGVEYQLGIVPGLTVYGDGRVIVTGPVPEIYPPAALPNLMTGTLSKDAIAALAERAAELDLLRPLDFGQPLVIDLPTTTVTINVDGAHEQSAYAFDFGEGERTLTAPQRDARRRLSTFTRELTDTATAIAREAYEPAEVAIYARTAGPGTDDPNGVVPSTVAWPLADLATVGDPSPDAPGVDTSYRCAVLSGADATTALAAAHDATSITRWRSGGADYTVVWRPLLPDEHDCP